MVLPLIKSLFLVNLFINLKKLLRGISSPTSFKIMKFFMTMGAGSNLFRFSNTVFSGLVEIDLSQS